jgi:hypothetical protein
LRYAAARFPPRVAINDRSEELRHTQPVSVLKADGQQLGDVLVSAKNMMLEFSAAGDVPAGAASVDAHPLTPGMFT